MKYENFEMIKNLADQIESHQRNLNVVLCEGNIVCFQHKSGRPIFRIGVDAGCTDEYSHQARELVDYIKKDIQSRIDNMKSQLELL